jgi:hypothetical protein
MVEQLLARVTEEIKAVHGVLANIHGLEHMEREEPRRVFDGKAALPPRILALIKEEAQLRTLACGDREVLLV